MSDIKEALKQHLVEQTRQLEAQGGPGALTLTGRALLESAETWLYAATLQSPRERETYYPLRAVLLALGYLSPTDLQEDWYEALGQPGPLPLYLHLTADGHYSAMIAERVVLDHLIWLTDACDAGMLAD